MRVGDVWATEVEQDSKKQVGGLKARPPLHSYEWLSSIETGYGAVRAAAAVIDCITLNQSTTKNASPHAAHRLANQPASLLQLESLGQRHSGI